MTHVPDDRLPRYRHLKAIADNFDRAGDYCGSEFMEDANRAYALAAKYRMAAQELRAKS